MVHKHEHIGTIGLHNYEKKKNIKKYIFQSVESDAL